MLLYNLFTGRHVGMADEADSKSVVGNHVWVQVPSPAGKERHSYFLCLFLMCAEHGTNLAGASPVTGIYRQV